MSISTLESTASVRALDRQHAEQDAWQRERDGACQEIFAAFGLMKTIPLHLISVPRVTVRPGGGTKVSGIPMTEAIRELLEEAEVVKHLNTVLAQSDCPLVAQLRARMMHSHIECWADDIAYQRSGD